MKCQCGSNNVHKRGNRDNKQRTRCNDCGKWDSHYPSPNGVKILLFDIETTPMEVFVWGLFGNKYIDHKNVIKDWNVLSWSAKWLFDSNVISDIQTPKEAINRDDKRLLKGIWDLIDKADIIIAHNGDKFDLRKIKARFLSNGIMPPMPYKTIDTLKIARKEFALSSNKQDYITKLLGVQKKLDTDFQLWIDCMNGDTKALKKMERYNKHDVIGLEQMYLKLRPYMTGHPNIAVMMEENVCSTCGSDSLNNVGKYYFTGSSRYELYYCNGCMSPHIRGKNNVSEKNIFVRSAAK
jgi:hypothetical protein